MASTLNWRASLYLCLGMIYLKGRGVPRSEETVLEWIKKAAAAGNPSAKKALADRRP